MLSSLNFFSNIDSMTAIQSVSLPALVSGRNALIKAQTGSGKTLAYAVPLLNYLIKLEPPITRSSGSLALIILPTRELAIQTSTVFSTLTRSCVRIVSGLMIGGIKRKSQKASLRKGINIVIGTPQRILDHMHMTKSLDLKCIRWLVIDEADRLLEMGFERDVRRILTSLTPNLGSPPDSGLFKGPTQVILLSATLT
ncbi:unnamed protein product, partial [Protopolystoma xenopodis]